MPRFVILLILGAATALAAESATKPMSLADCRAEVFRANRDFRTVRLALERARWAKEGAATEVFAPVLTTNYTAYSGDGDRGTAKAALTAKTLGFEVTPYVQLGLAPDGRTQPAGTTAAQASTAVGVTLSRKLFAISEHLKQRLPLTRADRDLFLAANQLVLQARALELRISQAFLAVQRSAARLAVRERRVIDAKEFLTTVKGRVEHGLAAPLDALNAEIGLNQAEADRLDEQAVLMDARQDLNNQMGRPPAATLDITPEPLDPPAEPPVDSDVGRVLAGNEDLGSQGRSLEVLEVELKVARDRLAPDVTAAATLESRATGPSYGSAQDAYDEVALLSVTWTLPLDGWQAERSAIHQLETQLQTAGIRLAQSKADLEAKLRSAARSIDRLRTGVTLAEQRLAAERARLTATLARYDAGAVDNLEVTRAKQAVDTAEISLVETRISLVLAGAGYTAQLPLRPTALAEGSAAKDPDQGR